MIGTIITEYQETEVILLEGEAQEAGRQGRALQEVLWDARQERLLQEVREPEAAAHQGEIQPGRQGPLQGQGELMEVRLPGQREGRRVQGRASPSPITPQEAMGEEGDEGEDSRRTTASSLWRE